MRSYFRVFPLLLACGILLIDHVSGDCMASSDTVASVVMEDNLRWPGKLFTGLSLNDCEKKSGKKSSANNYFPDTDDCCVGDGGFATADTVRMDVTFSVRGGECIVDTKKSCENKNFVIGIVNASMEYNVDEVRSAQQCYMLCDMKPSCYGMVFYTYVDPVTSTMSTYCVFAGAADCTNVNDCALSDSSTGFYSAMKCDSGWGSPI